MKNLTAIYWIKNEARYIPEYIEFHLLQGFDHFIFYDNKSNDNILTILEPYIKEELVEIRYYPENVTNRQNFWLMHHCINEQKNKTKWLHYHALDERLFSPTGKRVIDILNEYENYGGVSVAWEFFNSNGHITRPNGIITDNFTTSLSDNDCCIKTIIQPQFAIDTIGNPHNFKFVTGKHAVDENLNIVTTAWNPGHYSFNKLKLHHYVTMSREEFDIKMDKGLLDHADTGNVRRSYAEQQWNLLHNKNSSFKENTDLLKYSEIIKQNIMNRYQHKKELLKYINH